MTEPLQKSLGDHNAAPVEPITLVSGLARCGTTLVMTMLSAGGMPTTVEGPGFEDIRALELPHLRKWIEEARGRALKVLDPHRFIPPIGYEYRSIWLDRDVQEQARSIEKLLRAVGAADAPATRAARRRLARSLVTDRPKALAILRARGPVLELHFEYVLARPVEAAAYINRFVGGALDERAMAAAVRVRGPKCLKGLLELELLEETGT